MAPPRPPPPPPPPPPPHEGGSLLLARAKAHGSRDGVNLLSVADLFGDDDDDDDDPASTGGGTGGGAGGGAGGGTGGGLGGARAGAPSLAALREGGSPARVEPSAPSSARRESSPPVNNSRRDGSPRVIPPASLARDYRSTHANQRDEDGRLTWPPTPMDAQLDAFDAGVARDVRRAASRRLERGRAPDAKAVFEEELERQLTDLVVMMTIEACS